MHEVEEFEATLKMSDKSTEFLRRLRSGTNPAYAAPKNSERSLMQSKVHVILGAYGSFS